MTGWLGQWARMYFCKSSIWGWGHGKMAMTTRQKVRVHLHLVEDSFRGNAAASETNKWEEQAQGDRMTLKWCRAWSYVWRLRVIAICIVMQWTRLAGFEIARYHERQNNEEARPKVTSHRRPKGLYASYATNSKHDQMNCLPQSHKATTTNRGTLLVTHSGYWHPIPTCCVFVSQSFPSFSVRDINHSFPLSLLSGHVFGSLV